MVSHQNCCVVGCVNKRSKCPENTKFYRFPSGKRDYNGRRTKWIQAVKRVNRPIDGTKWSPAQWTVICSTHFVGNCISEHPEHPSFVPTIFPEVYNPGRSSQKRKIAETSLFRLQRRLKRQMTEEEVPMPSDTLYNAKEQSKCSSEGLDSPEMTRQSVRSLLHDQMSALINQTLPEEELILKLRSILDYAQPNALASLHKFQNVFNRKWAGDTQPFTSLQSDFQKLNLAQVSKDLRCFVISLNASERILKSRLDSASYIWSSTQAQILLSHTYVSSVNAGLKEIEAEVHQCLENINRLMLILNEFKSKLHNKCPDKPGTDADRLSAVKLEKADGYFHDETIGTDTIKIKEELNDDVHEFSENVVERTVKVEQEVEDEPYLYDQTSTTSAAEQDDHHRNTCHGENDIDLDMSVTLEPYGELVAQDREIVPTVFKRQFASKSTAKKENPGPQQSTTSSFKPAVTPPVKKGKRKIESSAAVPSSKRTRTNGFLHECKVCDARFRWKYELASHSGVHSDSNRHRCKQCNAGFSELSILQKHEKICTK